MRFLIIFLFPVSLFAQGNCFRDAQIQLGKELQFSKMSAQQYCGGKMDDIAPILCAHYLRNQLKSSAAPVIQLCHGVTNIQDPVKCFVDRYKQNKNDPGHVKLATECRKSFGFRP